MKRNIFCQFIKTLKWENICLNKFQYHSKIFGEKGEFEFFIFFETAMCEIIKTFVFLLFVTYTLSISFRDLGFKGEGLKGFVTPISLGTKNQCNIKSLLRHAICCCIFHVIK